MPTIDFLGNRWEYTCMGCAIADGTMLPPGGMIQGTRHFVVHQDPLIPLPGFLVVASTQHIHSISQMEDEEYQEFSELLKRAYQTIKDVTRVEHLTIIQEEYSSHFHLWFFPWTQAVIDKYGSPSLSKIRGIMADYKKEPISEVEWGKLEETITAMKNLLN